MSIEAFDIREDLQGMRPSPVEDIIQIPVDEDADKFLRIGALLAPEVRDRLTAFLLSNIDVFAWSADDMPGIDTKVASHHLRVDPEVRPVKQKKRNLGGEKLKAASEEVDKLLAAGFIREVNYPDWLANAVLVKKATGKWRMCIDYTDLNKACPKDSFPLPQIDRLVDNASGFDILSFMDAFSGYNQIRMHPEDEEKTSFITEKGTFCYRVMPFSLKNAGATYQRMINLVFRDQIGRNLEVYVDDMLVKSAQRMDHIADLTETFSTLRAHCMRLNPSKCTFRVASDKFLGYMITCRGIEANPEKIQAILDMKQPSSIKGIQRLNGRIIALSRFLSKSAAKSLPFLKVMRGAITKSDPAARKRIEWDEDCQQAFSILKEYLRTPPLLSRPPEGEILTIYLAVDNEAIATVLVRTDVKSQLPVYYVSSVLKGAELNYQRIEKAAFALIITARKLRPYFQAHRIEVLTDLPLEKNLKRLEKSGRMVNWGVELTEFDIGYKPRISIKAQALADFVVECTVDEREDEKEDEELSHDDNRNSLWILHVDGSSAESGSGAGVVLESPDKQVFEYALRFIFSTTNNEAEYEATIAGLKLSRAAGAAYVRLLSDSKLVAGHISGEYEAREEKMIAYLKIVKSLLGLFKKWEVEHIPRARNTRADALSKLASSAGDFSSRMVTIETLAAPTTDVSQIL